MEKTSPLQLLLLKNQNAPKQGSTDWLLHKRFTIGGSELASVIGRGYVSAEEFIVQKASNTLLGASKKTPAMLFGTILERFHKKYISEALGTPIYETGSIQHPSVSEQWYSPDGILQPERSRLLGLVGKIPTRFLPAILKALPETPTLLLELKSPYARTIKNGWCAVPGIYQPQVLAGLDTLRLCDACLYSEARFLIGDETRTADKHLATGEFYTHTPVRTTDRQSAMEDIIAGVPWSYERGDCVYPVQWALQHLSYHITLPSHGFVEKYAPKIAQCVSILRECAPLGSVDKIRNLVHTRLFTVNTCDLSTEIQNELRKIA